MYSIIPSPALQVLLEDIATRDVPYPLAEVFLGEELDYGYIESWVDRKGLVSLWRELIEKIRTAGL